MSFTDQFYTLSPCIKITFLKNTKFKFIQLHLRLFASIRG